MCYATCHQLKLQSFCLPVLTGVNIDTHIVFTVYLINLQYQVIKLFIMQLKPIND